MPDPANPSDNQPDPAPESATLNVQIAERLEPCTCIADQEARILGGFKDGKLQRPDRVGEPNRVRCDGSALNLTTGKGMLGIQFNAYFEGRKSPFSISVTAAYCPFCGTQIEESK